MEASLERIKAVLSKLGNPQNDFKAIHIAGTNGKGSVSAMLASVFKRAGYKTGLYISPYIINFRERIQINGQFITEQELCDYVKRIKSLGVKLTEFELITVIAFLYFKEKGIDVLICETGLGGRLDATNTLGNKIATVITKIGLDHTAILGDTIQKITEEKCGILTDAPLVTSPFQDPKAMSVIKIVAPKVIIPNLQELKKVQNDIGHTYIYKGNEYALSLCGEYQIENSLIAIEAINASGYEIPYDTIYEGLKETFFPARMEIIRKKPLVVLDGAHNPDGAAALSKELARYNNVTAIIGMLKDKDYGEFLKTTLKYCKNAVVVEIKDMPRSLSASQLAKQVGLTCPCVEAKDYLDAINKALEISDDGPIFIFGSLYLASAIRDLLIEKLK